MRVRPHISRPFLKCSPWGAWNGVDRRRPICTPPAEWRYWDATDGGYAERALPEIDGGWSPSAYFEGAVEHVVDLLEGEAENRSPGEAGLAALEVLIGLFVSHHVGGHVALPLDRPLHDVRIRSW